MSGLAGIVSLADRFPVSAVREQFQPALAALAHRGSPVCHTTEKSVLAVFPPRWASEPADPLVVHPLSSCTLAWDGRLDNRSELHRLLFPDEPVRRSDAALVLAAWLAWGERTPERLLGDFVFVVWDARQRSLFAARDALGLRPFFYSLANGRFVFASETRALLQLPGIPRTLDERMVSEFLLWWSAYPEVERTFFRQIRRLPPAHWLRWDASGLCVQPYWKLDPARQVIPARESEYAERFLELFYEAVRCRLQAARPAALFLSGGLDSAAVACAAARLGAAGSLIAFTGRAAAIADESPLASEVTRHAGIQHRILELSPAGFGPWLETCIARQAAPIADIGTGNDMLLAQAARQDGCRMILTGDGADELFGSPIHYLADLLRSGRLITAVRSLRPMARYNGYAPAYLLKSSLRLLLPRGILRLGKMVKWRQAPPWIAPGLAERTRLLSRLHTVAAKPRFDSIHATEDYFAFIRGRRIWMDEARELHAATSGVTYCYPFYDRRLLEFMFAIPWHTKHAGARNKIFLRNARDLLPPALQEISEKAGYARYWEQPGFLSDSACGLSALLAEQVHLDSLLNLPVVRGIVNGSVRLPREQTYVTLWGLQRFLLWFRHYGVS